MRFWQVCSRPEPLVFELGRGPAAAERVGRPIAVTFASRGYLRLPQTGSGASVLLWTSFVASGADGPSGSGLHIVFCGALKVSDPVEHLEISTKGVGKVPSLQSPAGFRMRFGCREIGREDRFAQDL